jgi:hypothetical protein
MTDVYFCKKKIQTIYFSKKRKENVKKEKIRRVGTGGC